MLRYSLWAIRVMLALIVFGICAANDRACSAQPPSGTTVPVDELLSKLVERPSALVVDIDITKIDVEAAYTWVLKRVGMENDPTQQATIPFVKWMVHVLKTAGVKHLYILVPTRVISDGGPLVIIPCRDVAAVEQLTALLPITAGADAVLKVRKQAELVMVGPQSVLDRLTANNGGHGEARRDLLEPLSNPERKDHVAVFSLADVYRQELIAIWPDSLPPQAPFQLSPRQLASDIQRISLSWNLPPQVAVEATIETVDAAAVERVQMVLKSVLSSASAQANGDEDAESIASILKSHREGHRIKLSLDEAAIDTLLAQGKALAHIAHRSQTSNHLKQIGIAIHNYHDVYRHLPPKYFIDRQGQPLLSWRVAILPYIEQAALYQSLKLDQPWNAAANQLPASVVIPTYADRDGNAPNKTRFRVPVFPGSAWDGEGPPKTFRDITDGASNTIAVIHAPPEAAVSWADPAEWKISPDNPMQDVFGDREEVMVMFFDASVRTLQRNELNNKKLAALLTIAGGELDE